MEEDSNRLEMLTYGNSLQSSMGKHNLFGLVETSILSILESIKVDFNYLT